MFRLFECKDPLDGEAMGLVIASGIVGNDSSAIDKVVSYNWHEFMTLDDENEVYYRFPRNVEGFCEWFHSVGRHSFTIERISAKSLYKGG